MKSLIIVQKNRSAIREAQLVSIRIPTIVLYNLEPNLMEILPKRKMRALHTISDKTVN